MHNRRPALPCALLTALLASALALGGCGGDDSGGDGASNGTTGDTSGTSSNATSNATSSNATTGGTTGGACPGGTRWEGTQPIFREVTTEWGLEGVRGVRLNAVDFDGDGWTDLLARMGGTTPDNFGPDGPRRIWLLRNTGAGTFEDVTESSGFLRTRGDYAEPLGRPGEVVAFGDVDNDGDLDAYAGVNTSVEDRPIPETSEIVLNQGDGTWALAPVENALRREDELDVPSGAAFTDVDRDGRLDIWISQSLPSGGNLPMRDLLYLGRSSGDGTFFNITRTFGLETTDWSSLEDLNAGRGHSFGWSAAACDLTNDGIPELLVGHYGRGPNHLWVGGYGEGDIQYTARGVESGFAFDHRDDWSDNESARCYCTINPDAPDCAGVPEPELIRCTSDQGLRWNHDTDREPYRLGGNTGAVVCADVNNDGHMDLITTEIVHWDVGTSSDPSELLINTGEEPLRFERPGAEATGLTRSYDRIDWNDGDITADVFDFDNDGWPDVYIGSTDYPGAKGLLYHQSAPGQFVPVPFELGIDHNRSHGVAHADFDRDGDLDLVVGHSRARCGDADDCYPTAQLRLFENVLGDAGNWVQIALEGGPGTNRAAIGARVEVTAGGVTQTQEVDGGYGHYGSQNDLTLHFGLGAACEAEVTIRWPNAALTTQTVTLGAGQRYRVVEGQEPVVVNAPGE